MALNLDYKKAHKFVREQRKKGSDVYWDGWDMVFWKPTNYGWTSKNGSFRKGRWGVESRVHLADDGTWTVPQRNVNSR